MKYGASIRSFVAELIVFFELNISFTFSATTIIFKGQRQDGIFCSFGSFNCIAAFCARAFSSHDWVNFALLHNSFLHCFYS